MALAIIGVSRCGVCEELVTSSDELVQFPPFVSNEADRLYFFSDSTFQQKIVENHELGAWAVSFLNEFESVSGPQGRLCAHCGFQILDFRDCFSIGVVSSSIASPLAFFNNVQLHVSHIRLWEHTLRCHAVFSEAIVTGELSGRAAMQIVNELRDVGL